jgi:hypothetical protein
MAADDYHSALRLYHVDQPWLAAKEIYTRCTGRSLDLRDLFGRLAIERHKCAHIGGYGVTSLWLRTVPESILALALAFDLLATVSAAKFRDGLRAHLANENSLTPSDVSLWFIQERRKDWAEIHEGRQRAARTGNDPQALFQAAIARAVMGQAVVRREKNLDVIDWAIGSVD